MTLGWRLDPAQRPELLKRFSPRYPELVADHVTLQAGALEGTPLPPAPSSAEIVGEADDGAGVQALVVRLNGTTDRPDGSTYHITWSLADGRRAVESNTVIAQRGWAPCEPVQVRLTPARLK